MKKILLLNMPFGALERPALGLSLLKARLHEIGVGCDVRYLTFSFADLIGVEEYVWVSSALPYIAFAGDWTFTEALYGERPEADANYTQQILRETWRLDEASINWIRRVRSFTSHFLDHCILTIPWENYALLGFTSTFEQNLASLALAKKIKAAHPGTIIVFGGANWEAEMGRELHRKFEFVDYVCCGEADESFPALVRHLLKPGFRGTRDGLPAGIVWRRGGESVYTGRSQPVRQMDSLPMPDFSDYFDQWSESSAALSVTPTVLMETSRGCWWGDKSHCTFCGLNGANMVFRSKSAARVLDEMCYLSDRWQTDRIEVVDNILDMKYFTDLLPAVAREGRSWEIFYEVKANLNRQQVALLRAAGVSRIQPGVESLSDHSSNLCAREPPDCGTFNCSNGARNTACASIGISFTDSRAKLAVIIPA